MSPRQQAFAVIAAIGLFLLIVDLVRRRKLREEYAWLWLLMGVAILLPTVFYDALVWLSQLIGAVVVTTTLFILALLFVILICIQFSVRISRLTTQVKDLAQEVALLRAREAADADLMPRSRPPATITPAGPTTIAGALRPETAR
ncbi:MAG: DUF2304 domain-containing protein [Chloroflexi bacterium]|nr:DUF2304 domain-containing protein [Chloroflexota bacterium]